MLDPNAIDRVNPDDAAAILWLDELVLNPDRTRHNPNLVWSRDHLWLIDHGAALNIQYSWTSVTEQSTKLPLVSHEPHLLRERAVNLNEWDELLAARLTREVIERAVAEVPDDFLAPLLPSVAVVTSDALDRRRAAYAAFLWKRLTAPRTWVGLEQLLPARKRGRPNWLR